MKHILFLTWKDLKHPRAGGAERVVYEYAKRLVSDGHKVTWFGSYFQGALQEEVLDGIHIIRKYSLHTIYFFAVFWYKRFIRKNPVDIIIDEAGGIPLLSPLYEKKVPLYFFIHHIGAEEYEKAFFFPLNKIFKRFVFWTFSLYKDLPTITVSYSTAQELIINHSFTQVSIIENATHLFPLENINWEGKKKEIVFYGRLTRMKRTDHAIQAFSLLLEKYPEYELNIIGNPQDEVYAQELHILTQKLGISESVHFLGFSQNLVDEYLPRALVLLVPSQKEGYGLIVLEGNCFGLPALAYNVAGLRDSIRDGKNGILVVPEDATALGNALLELITDENKLKSLSESSLAFMKDFGTWDERYHEFKKIIQL